MLQFFDTDTFHCNDFEIEDNETVIELRNDSCYDLIFRCEIFRDFHFWIHDVHQSPLEIPVLFTSHPLGSLLEKRGSPWESQNAFRL